MKIIVCIKQIRHTYARSGMDPERHFLTSEDHITRINPCDEAALEAALKIKDDRPETRIILLTLGKIRAEAELRRCLALGADEIFRIDMDLPLDSFAKSRQLAGVAQQLRADLILCGKESLDLQNGQVGAFMAHQLDCPFVSAIVDLEYSAEENCVQATRSCGRGVREKVRCRLPAVLSVDMGMFAHRVARHTDLERASAAPIQTAVGFLEPTEPMTSVSQTMPPRPRTMRTPAPDSSLPAIKRIQQLLAGSKVEKKGQMLKGEPEVLVEGIIDYLTEHGFVDV
jgi:electron transfer flavoprotein beta subunit